MPHLLEQFLNAFDIVKLSNVFDNCYLLKSVQRTRPDARTCRHLDFAYLRGLAAITIIVFHTVGRNICNKIKAMFVAIQYAGICTTEPTSGLKRQQQELEQATGIR